MITYIYHKDSTLWAFEGPEEPHCLDDAIDWKKYGNDMFTARESSLPVVNAEEALKKHHSDWYRVVEQGIINKVKSEPVALPGWGLEKVGQKQFQSDPTQRWYTRDQGWPYNDIHNYREAYRLVRSEPEKKRKKSNTLTGDDLLKQFVNKQIKLTVYSQKLWHSDKPFPVREHFHSLSFEDNQKLYLNHIKENWLSTAYEVVNPEVIPQIKIMFEGDRKCLHLNSGAHSLKELVDGDQIPLQDGFMISTSVQYPIDSPTKYFATIKDLHYKPVVEPSESQEEDQIDLLSEILVDYKTWLDDPESGMRDYETFQAKQLEKFTITRK